MKDKNIGRDYVYVTRFQRTHAKIVFFAIAYFKSYGIKCPNIVNYPPTHKETETHTGGSFDMHALIDLSSKFIQLLWS